TFGPMLHLLIEQPCGIEDEQSVLRPLDIALGNGVLDRLLGGDRLAPREAADGALGHHVDQMLDEADIPLGVVKPASSEARLRNPEALTDRTESRRVR